MGFMRETPKSLAVFFAVAGILGLLAGSAEMSQLNKIEDEVGLTQKGKIYKMIAGAFLGIAAFLVVGGLAFKKIATAMPKLIPTVLTGAIVLKVIILIMFPMTAANAIISLLILGYLVSQYKRISLELVTQAAPAKAVAEDPVEPGTSE